MPHVDESKRLKLFGDLTNLPDRDSYYVDRRGRRIGDGAVTSEHDAPITAPSAAPPQILTISLPANADEICVTCGANGSCPSYCRTCGGGRTIVAPCPLGRW